MNTMVLIAVAWTWEMIMMLLMMMMDDVSYLFIITRKNVSQKIVE